jgi:hypothetical protein
MAAATAGASALEATYKVREAEGILDLYFYRKIGFRLAQFFARLRMSPVSVTLLGGVFGILAGHLYYYRDLRTNIIGMFLHVLANALDNADGQLARLTGHTSREGRIIDSLVDHVIFVGIYVHLAARCLAGGASPVVLVLIGTAALSHAIQGAAADYYRNGFRYIVKNRAQSQLDSSAAIRRDYQRLSWRREPWQKFLLATYLNFTRQQEMLSPKQNRLRGTLDQLFPATIPKGLQADYRAKAAPMFKWWGLLMTNSRMLILFFCLLMARPIWFFWVELTLFNGLLIFLMLHQDRMYSSLLQTVARAEEPAVIGG